MPDGVFSIGQYLYCQENIQANENLEKKYNSTEYESYIYIYISTNININIYLFMQLNK